MSAYGVGFLCACGVGGGGGRVERTETEREEKRKREEMVNTFSPRAEDSLLGISEWCVDLANFCAVKVL